MDLYNANAICVKCGYHDIFSSFMAKEEYECYAHHCQGDGRNQEHIHRGCRRCGYKWGEKTLNLNQKPLTPASKVDSEPTYLPDVMPFVTLTGVECAGGPISIEPTIMDFDSYTKQELDVRKPVEGDFGVPTITQDSVTVQEAVKEGISLLTLPKSPVLMALDDLLPDSDISYAKYRAATNEADRSKFYGEWATSKLSDHKAG